MCNVTGILFGAINLSRDEINGKRVLEVGAYDMSGSLRPYVESLNPSEYFGVDIEKGPNVDVVCRAEDLIEKFGENSFDVVISTELLEHVRDWRKVISNFKRICKPNGILLITTRSYGFNYHAFPYDYWRYEIEDMKNIFSDLEILKLEKDTKEPGIFVKLRKPDDFKENELKDYELYSIVSNKKVKEIDDREFNRFYFWKISSKARMKKFFFDFGKKIYNKF